ncbi:MAG: polyprenol monophosphomannose synthase [Acidimicrobiia bacterium]
MSDQQPRVVIVLPTYQEAENIQKLVRAVHAAAPLAGFIVCDDNSPDGTGQLAEALVGEIPDLQVVHRPDKLGLGAAYRDGFARAIASGADIVLQMDVDFSHDPAVVPLLIAAVSEGADVAIGSRYVPGGNTPDWPFHRKMLSKYGNEYARWMLRLGCHDATAGFRAYRADILTAIKFEETKANGYGFQIETAWRLTAAGAKFAEVPITFRDRTEGESKMSIAIMSETMRLVTRWGIGLRRGRSMPE